MTGLLFFAEVMDKEPTIGAIWLWFIAAGLVGFALCRFDRWFVVFVLPVVGLMVAAWISELHSWDVGPWILREAGRWYVVQSHIAMGLSVVLPICGALTGRRAER